MRYEKLACAVLLLAASTPGSASSSSYVVPTTTLAAQTGNNTSAANSFTSQSNGNRGAGNISKVDVHTLLYSGNTTKVYAHMVLWFGQSNHMNNGYSETDATQVNSQIDDMVSRGIDGAIIDWYGPGNQIDQATKLVMAAAESHPGFTFAIMIDEGALEWDSCSGCSPQQALINQLQYIETTYFPSPAYMKIEGHPMVTNFNIDLLYSIDWNAATAALSTQPFYIFQNNNGFSHTLSGGSYAWVMPTASDFGLPYLTSFYQAGMGFPSEQTVGATYKGFNDTLASWGSDRIMNQQCGQTWLQTFSELNGLYNSGKQLPELQLVTWNDYEEATEIESGIDNCLSISSSSVSSNTLQWNISGNENTVDHYSVYISSDGENLMELTDTATGDRSVNLCSFPIPEGSYKMFVQAVGKPSLANQITGAITYSPSCASTAPGSAPATIAFSASPNSLSITPGESGTLTVSAKPQSGSFNSTISLSCDGVPSTLSCSFSPAVITPGSGTASSTLTIASASVTASNFERRSKRGPLYASWLLPVGISLFGLLGNRGRRRRVRKIALLALLGMGTITVACGGGTGTSQVRTVASPSSYSVTVQGKSGSSQFSTTVNVTVQ